MTHPEKQALLSELNRAKVLFQARTIKAVLGLKEKEEDVRQNS